MTKSYKPKKKDIMHKKENEPYVSKKDYIVFVLGGHAGHGYGIPFLHWIRASSEEDAIKLAVELPHVKHHKRDAVLLCLQRSRKEGLFIKLINDMDTYLTESTLSGNKLSDRRIRTAGYIAGLCAEFKKTGAEKLFADILAIKRGCDFDDEHPLQQLCGPVLTFSKTLSTEKLKNLTDDEFLDFFRKYAKLESPRITPEDAEKALLAYYTIMTKKIAMAEVEEPERIKETRKGIETLDKRILADDKRLMEFRDFEFNSLRRVQMLMIYNKVMGGNNPLGIRYDSKNHMMTYPSLDDPKRIVRVPIPNVPYVVANDMFLDVNGPQLKNSGQSDEDKQALEDFDRNMQVTIEERLIIGTKENENKPDEISDELSK